MNKLLPLIFPLAITFQACSQYIGKSRRGTIRGLQSSVKYHHYKGNPIEEGDYFVALHVNDTSWYRTSFFYDFNKQGKCFRERVITYCDTCFRKYRNERLDKKRFDWIKVTDSFYVSKFSKQRTLETHSNGQEWTIEHTRVQWTKADYAALLKRTP